MKDLQEKIEQGYKRLAIVNTIIATVLAIPTLFATHIYKECAFPIILLYMMVLCACILWSPKIVNKIWK
jgi:hypothetical protein